MSTHSDFAAAFRGGLFDGTLPPGLTASGPGEAERRFAVYRNNVTVSLIRALAQRFPVVERLVGSVFFAAMAQVFVRECPPHTPVLHEYGDALPGFLERFPPAAKLPYLADVARVELARGRAYHAADLDPVAPAALAAAASKDPERVALRLHPSVSLVDSPHPVATIWLEHSPGHEPLPIRDWRVECALVARSGDTVLTEAIDAGSAAFIAALLDGESLAAASARGSAAAPGFAEVPLLARLIARGLVVDIHEGERR